MRFIHTSDWHLGRLFHGKHLTQDQSYVLEEFYQVVKDTKPNAILIAGDIYDRAVPPIEAVELLDDTLARLLLDQKIPVIMIAGNHDSAQRIGFGSKLLAGQGLYVTGQLTNPLKPVVLTDSFGDVYFMPFTYAEPSLVRSVYQRDEWLDFDGAMKFLVQQSLQKIPQGVRKVALAHAFIAGGQESESERPLSVGGSSNVSAGSFAAFDYTALGHLHNSQQAGGKEICYSGSLMKYSFDEANQTKGINIVDMDRSGQLEIERISLKPKYDVCKVSGYFADILQNREKYPIQDDYMMVSLKDRQAILDVHGQLEKIYPNLMQIERPYLNIGGELAKERLDYRTKTELQLFDDFFRQMTDLELSQEQKQTFATNLDELLLKAREGKS